MTIVTGLSDSRNLDVIFVYFECCIRGYHDQFNANDELYRGKSEMTDIYFQLRYIQTSSRNAVNKKLFLTSLLM
jgi:hypothetical protein